MTNPETSSDLAQAVWDDIVERTTHLWAGDTVMAVLAESDNDRGAADEFAHSVKYAIATTIERLTAERNEAREAHDADAKAFLSANARAEAAEERAIAAESLNARQAEALKPFAGDKMPGLRHTLRDYDRYGLRRSISPMEIAMLRARQALEDSKP